MCPICSPEFKDFLGILSTTVLQFYIFKWWTAAVALYVGDGVLADVVECAVVRYEQPHRLLGHCVVVQGGQVGGQPAQHTVQLGKEILHRDSVTDPLLGADDK